MKTPPSSVFKVFLLGVLFVHTLSASESPVLVKFGYGALQTSSSRTDNRSFSVQSAFELSTLGKISERGYFSITASYIPKIYVRVFDGDILKEKNTSIQIGLGYAHQISESFKVAMDLGTHYRLTDAELIYISPGLDPSNDTSARDNTEYGVNFGAGYTIVSPIDRKFGLDFDIKYFLSATPKNNESANHVTYFLNFVFPWDTIN